MEVDLHNMRTRIDEILENTTPVMFETWLRKHKRQKQAAKYDLRVMAKEERIKELARQLNERYKFMISG